MKQAPSSLPGVTDSERVIETIIKVGLLGLLLFYCFMILQPFLVIIIWALVIAVALFPLYAFLEKKFGGRRKLAAFAVTLILLAIIILPMVLLGESLAEGITYLINIIKDENLEIPPPSAEISSWPLIGKPLASLWQEASDDIETMIFKYNSEIKDFLSWFVGKLTTAGVGFLKFLLSIVLAGIFLAFSGSGKTTLQGIARKVAGEKGAEYMSIISVTIKNVSIGIIGIAMLQSVMAGVGFLVAGIPGAGLWALIAFILAIIQIGLGPIIIPVLIYTFFYSSTLTFILLTIWCTPILFIDNILKPIIFGRNAPVPMLVVFLGSIGGFLASGILGLFVGAVVLTLGYTFFQLWMKEDERLPVIEQNA
ncbi:AI-2E family transporter [Bacteroidota bacterium]